MKVSKLLLLFVFPYVIWSQDVVDVYTIGDVGAIKATGFEQSIFFQRDGNTGSIDVNYTITKNTGNSSVLSHSTGSINIADGEYGNKLYISYDSGTGDDTYTITVNSGTGYTIGTSSDTFTAVENEPLPAFPSAYGAGAYTDGWRGGTVYHVTTLDWDGVGGLKEALTATVPRIIVFDVAGDIYVDEYVNISGSQYSNVYVAGQTAPGRVTIVPSTKFSMWNMDDVVWRYVDVWANSTSQQPLDLSGIQGLIVDHVSVKYAVGTALLVTTDATRVDGQGNNTIQWCELAESGSTGMINGASFLDTRYNRAGDNTVHRNLFYNISHRTSANYDGRGRFESINNLIYNMNLRFISLRYIDELNQQGDYYKWGPRTNSYNLTQNTVRTDVGIESNSIWTEGNYMSGLASNQTDNWNGWSGWNGGSTVGDFNLAIAEGTYRNTTAEPQKLGRSTPVWTSQQAYDSVLTYAGNTRHLDGLGNIVDHTNSFTTTYRSDVEAGISSYEDPGGSNGEYRSVSGLSYPGSDYPTDSGTRPAGYDTDDDGMPDAWETATFGDLTRDGTDDQDADGYTDLEEYLNLIDGATSTPPAGIGTILRAPGGRIRTAGGVVKLLTGN